MDKPVEPMPLFMDMPVIKEEIMKQSPSDQGRTVEVFNVILISDENRNIGDADAMRKNRNIPMHRKSLPSLHIRGNEDVLPAVNDFIDNLFLCFNSFHWVFDVSDYI